MLLPTIKEKTCAQCGTQFRPFSSTSRVCSPVCASKWVRAEKKAKNSQEREQFKERKAKLKTNGERKAGAQAALNRWVVHGRDVDQPCISCGRFHQGANHGGHYRSRGSAPHLALDPRNVHRQCYPCNVQLHGNLINYRLGLIARYGVEYVEALEADQEPRHHSGADYDAIKADFVQRLKNLKGATK